MDVLANVLPRMPADLTMVVVRKERAEGGFVELRVRRERVASALRYLMEHNPLYRDVVQIAEYRLGQLPEDGVIPIRVVYESAEAAAPAAASAVPLPGPDPAPAPAAVRAEPQPDVAEEPVAASHDNGPVDMDVDEQPDAQPAEAAVMENDHDGVAPAAPRPRGRSERRRRCRSRWCRRCAGCRG